MNCDSPGSNLNVVGPRIFLITGANGGLGRAMATAFLREDPGHVVWCGIRTRRDAVHALADEFEGRVHPVELEVTSPDAWQAAVEGILRAHHRLDVLVNNAGHHEDHLVGRMPPEAWDRVVRANLDGVFHGCQAVLPTMISQRSGRIVNVASLSAWLAPAGQANYAAAKAGVLALTQSLAKEVARIGITINAVCPGYIETEAIASWSTEQRQAALARVPARRFGKPEEVAAAVRFLACPEAAYITGSSLKIDGGIL